MKLSIETILSLVGEMERRTMDHERRTVPAPLMRLRGILLIALMLALFYWVGHGRGWKLWLVNKVWVFHPWVTGTRPQAGEVGVLPDSFVASEVMLPNLASGVDPKTLT